jgi:hypothetical protein
VGDRPVTENKCRYTSVSLVGSILSYTTVSGTGKSWFCKMRVYLNKANRKVTLLLCTGSSASEEGSHLVHRLKYLVDPKIDLGILENRKFVAQTGNPTTFSGLSIEAGRTVKLLCV